MDRFLRAICVGAVLLCGPVNAKAQAPSPEALAAAKEFIVASKMADQMKQILAVLPQALKPPGDPAAMQDYDLIASVMINAMKPYMDAYVDDVAQIYARHFTADEIRQLTSFYRTPAVEKFMQKQPELARELATSLQKLSPMMEKTKKDLIEEILKRRQRP